MGHAIALVTLVVRDCDEAIAFPKDRSLAFCHHQRHALGDGKRWVVIAPPDGRGAALLLAGAATPEQAARVGDQTGGRVALFLHTDDFWADYRHMQDHGIRFAETDIAIQPLTAANQTDLNRCDNAFTVDAELHLVTEDGNSSYTVAPVAPYVKRYGSDIYDAQAYIEKPDHAAWMAGSPGRSRSMRAGAASPSSGTSPWTRLFAAGASAAG